MSGGSYDYLCNADLLGGRTDDLTRMADALDQYPGGAQAAARTRALIDYVNRAEADLEKVWHAVEWHESCDWGEDQVVEVLARYNAETGGGGDV